MQLREAKGGVGDAQWFVSGGHHILGMFWTLSMDLWMFVRVLSPKNYFKIIFRASTSLLFEKIAIFGLRPRAAAVQKLAKI